jgi:hypothetical protein
LDTEQTLTQTYRRVDLVDLDTEEVFELDFGAFVKGHVAHLRMTHPVGSDRYRKNKRLMICRAVKHSGDADRFKEEFIAAVRYACNEERVVCWGKNPYDSKKIEALNRKLMSHEDIYDGRDHRWAMGTFKDGNVFAFGDITMDIDEGIERGRMEVDKALAMVLSQPHMQLIPPAPQYSGVGFQISWKVSPMVMNTQEGEGRIRRWKKAMRDALPEEIHDDPGKCAAVNPLQKTIGQNSTKSRKPVRFTLIRDARYPIYTMEALEAILSTLPVSPKRAQLNEIKGEISEVTDRLKEYPTVPRKRSKTSPAQREAAIRQSQVPSQLIIHELTDYCESIGWKTGAYYRGTGITNIVMWTFSVHYRNLAWVDVRDADRGTLTPGDWVEQCVRHKLVAIDRLIGRAAGHEDGYEPEQIDGYLGLRGIKETADIASELGLTTAVARARGYRTLITGEMRLDREITKKSKELQRQLRREHIDTLVFGDDSLPLDLSNTDLKAYDRRIAKLDEEGIEHPVKARPRRKRGRPHKVVSAPVPVGKEKAASARPRRKVSKIVSRSARTERMKSSALGIACIVHPAPQLRPGYTPRFQHPPLAL